MSQVIHYLPWISLAIALIAVVARDGVSFQVSRRRQEAPAGAFIVLVVLVGLAMLAGWKYPDFANGLVPALTGFGIGILLVVVAYGIGLFPSQAAAGRSAPIAMAAAAVCFAGWYGDKGTLAMVFGAASAGWLLSVGKAVESNPWAMRAAIMAGSIVGANFLGTQALGGDAGPAAGTILALMASLAGILGGVCGLFFGKKSGAHIATFVAALIAVILWVGGATLLTRQGMLLSHTPYLLGGAAILGAIVHWLIPEDLASTTVRTLLGAVLWVAAATIAFGYEKGFGMAVALVGGAGMLLLIGNRRALLSLGPLAALVLYRVFRTGHPDASEAFDIGQHYAMIGVLLGAMLPIMAQEWLRVTSKKAGGAVLLAGGLWILLLAAAPIPVAVGLSDKGIVGYMVGLGLAPVLEGARGERATHSLALTLGLSAAMTLLYDWLSPHLNIDRHGKLIALAWILGVFVVAGFLIAALSSGSEEKVKQPEQAQAPA